MTADPPTWFELADLAVKALIPLAVVMLGLLVKRYADLLERRRVLVDVAINWRLEVFRTIAPKLNLLRCFFTYVGDWKNIDLEQVSNAKRDCDRAIYMNAFLFAPETIQAWRDFVDAAFVENRGPGQEFAFRASVKRHREQNRAWRDEWTERFLPHENRLTRERFLTVHDRVLSLIVRDIGVGLSWPQS